MLIRNGLILILAALYVEAKLEDVWEMGYRAGYKMGYQEGLQKPPSVWQSNESPSKIVKSTDRSI
jgi:hypothetical protein